MFWMGKAIWRAPERCRKKACGTSARWPTSEVCLPRSPTWVPCSGNRAIWREQNRITDRPSPWSPGTKDDVAGTLGNIANVLDGQGDLAGARKMQEEGLRNFRAVADKRGVSSTLSNLGALLREQGTQ